jgi:hypothetical protein
MEQLSEGFNSRADSLRNEQEVELSFEDIAGRVIEELLTHTEDEAERQMRYYHNRKHSEEVMRRASAIYHALQEEESGVGSDREILILQLAAAGHDVLQRFENQEEGQSRRRVKDLSEDDSVACIHSALRKLDPDGRLVSESDLQLIAEAISCTKADFSPEKGIFQPALGTDSSLVARSLALADLGGLGMSGPEQFYEESARVFLEENPDIFKKIWDHQTHRFVVDSLSDDEYELILARLHGRVKFDKLFTEKRFEIFDEEVRGLSEEQRERLASIFSFDDAIKTLILNTCDNRLTMYLEQLLESSGFRKYLPEYELQLQHYNGYEEQSQ